jgi:hexokinase
MGKFDPRSLSEFARYYGFHYDIIDPVALAGDVRIDMERGLKGEATSLPMIPAFISPVAKAESGETVVALDAGGTNLRASLVRFDENGKAQPSATEKVPMPGTSGRVNADAFFDQIASVTAPLIEKSPDPIKGIGFCFSYPMEITKDADGILLAFSKEVDAPDVVGKAIGAGLKEALKRRNVKVPGRVVLLNDTVATLLSGLADPSLSTRKGADLYGVGGGPVVGFILGTGFNTAYPESRIPKINFESETNPQVVVCESGTFASRYVGYLDREYDSTTKNPGGYTLEKATAGAYLGPLTFHILKQAIKDGLIKFARSKEFLDWPTLQTKDLNAFMHAPLAKEGPIGTLFEKDEIDALRSLVYITSIITERAALLSAGVVAGAALKSSEGFDPFVPVRIAVEGTTYMIYKGKRTALEAWLHIMLTHGKPRSYVIGPVEQASLFGAAVAALTK